MAVSSQSPSLSSTSEAAPEALIGAIRHAAERGADALSEMTGRVIAADHYTVAVSRS